MTCSVSRESVLFLQDIESRCLRILEYTTDMTFDDFVLDSRTRDAVERSFQVIGDAVKALPQDVRDQAAQLPWSMLARFRDIVTHAYFRVDPLEVWNAIRDEVQPLLEDLGVGFGTKHHRRRRLRAYEAAWARLQHQQPGHVQDPVDQAFA